MVCGGCFDTTSSQRALDRVAAAPQLIARYDLLRHARVCGDQGHISVILLPGNRGLYRRALR